MGDFWDAWWQQTYRVKSIVFGNVRMHRTTLTLEDYLVSLLPPSVPKAPNDWHMNALSAKINNPLWLRLQL